MIVGRVDLGGATEVLRLLLHKDQSKRGEETSRRRRGGADFPLSTLYVHYSNFRRLHLNSILKEIFHFMCIIRIFLCCVKCIEETLRGLMQGNASNLHLLFGSYAIMSIQ